MPKIADKNYTEKRLEILDEGERHIELIALFKTYAINLSILILAIVVGFIQLLLELIKALVCYLSSLFSYITPLVIY